MLTHVCGVKSHIVSAPFLLNIIIVRTVFHNTGTTFKMNTTVSWCNIGNKWILYYTMKSLILIFIFIANSVLYFLPKLTYCLIYSK